MNDATVDIEAYLSDADSKLAPLIQAVVARIGVQRIAVSKASPFEALVRAIIYQSVSGKAGAAIYRRVRAAVKPLTPRKVLALTLDILRAAGLSTGKAKAVHALAVWFDANPKLAKSLPDLPDAEIVANLTAIPGIGAWTANVFLIFSLGRMDVMPAADLGIRRGVQLVYGLKDIATPAMVIEKASHWQPYRSIASMYLWQAGRVRLTHADLLNAG